MRPIETRYLDPRDILTQVYMREKNFRSTFMMTKTVRAAWMSSPALKPGPGWGYTAHTGGKCSGECTVSPHSTIKCNCILHTPFILPLWPRELAYLALSACGLYNRMDAFFRCSRHVSQHIPHSPSNHNISCFFLSYIHNISYIHISLLYLVSILCFILLYLVFYLARSPLSPSSCVSLGV